MESISEKIEAINERIKQRKIKLDPIASKKIAAAKELFGEEFVIEKLINALDKYDDDFLYSQIKNNQFFAYSENISNMKLRKIHHE